MKQIVQVHDFSMNFSIVSRILCVCVFDVRSFNIITSFCLSYNFPLAARNNARSLPVLNMKRNPSDIRYDINGKDDMTNVCCEQRTAFLFSVLTFLHRRRRRRRLLSLVRRSFSIFFGATPLGYGAFHRCRYYFSTKWCSFFYGFFLIQRNIILARIRCSFLESKNVLFELSFYHSVFLFRPLSLSLCPALPSATSSSSSFVHGALQHDLFPFTLTIIYTLTTRYPRRYTTHHRNTPVSEWNTGRWCHQKQRGKRREKSVNLILSSI